MASRGWTCPKCRHLNAPAHRKCRGAECGKPKPPKREPKHRKVLRTMSREDFARLNVVIHDGDEWHCPCCGRLLVMDGMNQREHDHRSGWARGLTCWHCNHQLLRNHTLETARMIVRYLERVEAFYTASGGGV